MDGDALSVAKFSGNKDVVVDQHTGNIYVMDQSGSRIRCINYSTKLVSTIAGNGLSGSTVNGNLKRVVWYFEEGLVW